MEITQTTVPGGGVVHAVRTRAGGEFRLLVEPDGERRFVVDDPSGADERFVEIVLEGDEADVIAEILHSAPIIDRVVQLERRLEEHLDLRARGRAEGAGDAGPPGSRA